MSSGKKLVVAAMVVACATIYMAYLGASASWKYYLTANECLAGAGNLTGSRVRVSGRIAAGTLSISPGRNRAEFVLSADEGGLPVVCSATLPDNLAEQIDVVVEGRLEEGGVLRGDKVLARCASKYESRQAVQPPRPSETVARQSRGSRR
jgi:cytochrome c-type biogenesis protein CcmE